MISSSISATELARLIRSGEVSAVETAQHYLERLDATNPDVNAIVWIDRDDVLRRAQESDDRIRRGDTSRPFEGVPMPIKDLVSVRNQPVTYSSLAVTERVAEENEVTVDLIEEAGFVLFGRSNSPEFGALTASENQRWGKTRNPWNLEYTSGGSSGGASAAVAADIAPIANASDGGGSIRVPSAATGLVGLKPSRGRIPNDIRAWEHSTTEGAITRTIEDAAGVLDAIAKVDLLGWYSAPAPARPYLEEIRTPGPRLRVGLLLEAPTGVEVDPQNREAAEITARALEALGHHVTPVSPFLFSERATRGFADLIINASTWSSPIEDPEKLDTYIKYRYDRATLFHAGQYAEIAALLQWETRQVAAQWGRDFDILLTPTTAVPTPRVGSVYDEGNEDPAGPRLTEFRTISFTAFCNISGLPAISLPVHIDSHGVPLGAQLVGGPYDEATLLRVGAELEQVFDWQHRQAPMVATAGTR
ncbi:amidase [Microbacterium oleivorans]|uniref:amidase n=1 Tax=Microbacterium oleivorans TaxID=273677 RepID=UPI0010A43A75|nr:amidase [Microbacterium oleivorans]THE07699.1 amidase [Microbacterium oleivorans]